MAPMTPHNDVPEYKNISNQATEHTGDIAFYEIPCEDPDRAMSFYHEVFGWNPHPDLRHLPGYRDGVDSISCFMGNGMLRGGFVKVHDPADLARDDAVLRNALPTVNVRSEDIDATMDKVVQNGGRVHLPKLAIFGGKMGTTARFIDTEGNVCAVWQAPVA